MIEITYPLWFLILPLPYIIYKYFPAYETKQSAIKVPFFSLLLDATEKEANEGSVRLKTSKWQNILFVVFWFGIVISLTKPVWLGEEQTRELSGRDVMFVLDLSGSMDTRDFTTIEKEKISRLDAAKTVLKDFVKERKGDRIGLILFGDNSYLQSPFTSDYEAWLALLDETEVAMAGPSTHLGDAIGLSIKIFKDEKYDTEKEKVAIILTDGNDTDSLVPPNEAAILAYNQGVKIHMIAMGDPLSTGEEEIDMETIENIAKTTGGLSYQALSSVQLKEAYDEIGKISPELYESKTFQPKVSVHEMPIQIMLMLFLIIIIFKTVKNKILKGGKNV